MAGVLAYATASAVPAGPGLALALPFGRNAGTRRRGAGGGQRRSTQQDKEGKYLSHNRKVYTPAGFNSVTGPMSSRRRTMVPGGCW